MQVVDLSGCGIVTEIAVIAEPLWPAIPQEPTDSTGAGDPGNEINTPAASGTGEITRATGPMNRAPGENRPTGLIARALMSVFPGRRLHGPLQHAPYSSSVEVLPSVMGTGMALPGLKTLAMRGDNARHLGTLQHAAQSSRLAN